jgi:hypothetical protein
MEKFNSTLALTLAVAGACFAGSVAHASVFEGERCSETAHPGMPDIVCVFPSIATGNDRGAEWFIRWPRRELPHACALASTWIAGFRDINEQSEWRRRWLPRLWAECPLRVPLCALHLGLSQLTCILLVGKLLVLWACQRGKKRNNVINLRLR